MLWWLRLLPLLLLLTQGEGGAGAGDGNEGNGGTGNDADKGDDPPADTDSEEEDTDGDELDGDDADEQPVKRRAEGTAFEKGFKDLLGKHGENPRRLAETLYRNNYDLRESNRLLRQENQGLAARQPRRGNMILTSAEAADYKAYKALGKPADVRKQITDAGVTSRQLAERQKDDTLREVAELASYNFRALKDSRAGQQTFAIKEVEANGSKKRQAFVVVQDGSTTKEVPVNEYVEQNLDYLLPALTNGGGNQQQQRQRWVQQSGGNRQDNNNNNGNRNAASSVLDAYGPVKKDK